MAAATPSRPFPEPTRVAEAIEPASPMAPRQGSPSRSDPRHPDSPDHALYNEIQRCLPQLSDDRLVQCTAACHTNGITASNMNSVHLNEDTLTLTFRSESPLATPAQVRMDALPPETEQAIQQIQQFDRQMEQIAQASQQRSAQMAQGAVL